MEITQIFIIISEKYDDTEELSQINNETIINQKNFFIIIPESTKSSRQNYSQALNHIVEGGKEAASILTNIVKTKLNKTKTSTKKDSLEIPQNIIDQIQDNSTHPICIMHEGTTFFMTPRNNKTIIDRVHKLTTATRSSTVSVTEVTSTLSINSDLKDISDKIFAKIKSNSSTSTKTQTHKIIIPSNFDGTEKYLELATLKMETSTLVISSKKSNNLTNVILDALNTLKYDMSPQTKKSTDNSEIKFHGTTCFPVYKIIDVYSSTMNVIVMNHSQNITEETSKPSSVTKASSSPANPSSPIQSKISNLTSSTHIVTPKIKTAKTTLNSVTTLGSYSHQTSSTCGEPIGPNLLPETSIKTKIETTTKSTDKLTQCTESSDDSNIQENENIKFDNSMKNLTKPREISTVNNTTPIEKDSKYEHDDCTDIVEDNENRSNNTNIGHENCEKDDSYQKPKVTTNKETNIYPSEETEQSTSCSISRRQKMTTQMLHQNIFSPTLIEYGKQKNGSLLVIKLISESDRPSDLEDLEQKRFT